MIRETTYDAYEYIKANGLLGARQWEVYHWLTKHGPCTANELYDFMDESGTAQVNNNTATRLGELRDRGVVTEVDERKCTITDRRCIVWQCTSQLPKAIERNKIPKREQLRRLRAATNYALKVFKERGRSHYDEMQNILAGE